MTEIKVAQTPSSVSATQGGSVLLNCTFEVISSSVGKFGWRRPSLNLEISDQIPFYRDSVVRSGQKLFAQKTAFIEIKDLAKFDSDLYVCEVEIRGVGKGKGNGTELIVIDNIIEMPGHTFLSKDRGDPTNLQQFPPS
ncbi:natural cytotoxicity triggering receptor 3-like [Pristis pectinata]|uniref:natural cytotoxicity triggering receptor 3-like n=1 Tax=Pristis pectinata TaxID=685728 RepID=UPI00223D9778|nr:natural cytotoxicity triggering receptor 3-like [Pristis pectinata]